MEKSTGRTIRLGIMVLVSAVIFTVAAYLIGQKRDLFSRTFDLRAVFNNVNGLQPGNNVRYGGINVGSVLSIAIKNDSIIEVSLRIKEKIRPYIKKNARVSIGTDGLMGNMIVNISAGTGLSPMVENNDVLESYSRIKTDDILTTLNVTNENAAILTANLLEMTQSVMRGKGIISYLMYDTVFRDKLDESVHNLAATTQKTNELMKALQLMTAELAHGKGLAGWVLNDTTTERQVATMLTELSKAAGDINSSAVTLHAFVDELKQGQGAVPALMQDTTLARDFRESLVNINQGTKKFDENMEALKHSFLTRRYFKKMARDSANKNQKK